MEQNEGAAASAPAPAVDTAPAAPPPGSIEALVERWWEDHFPGSAVAQITAVWNVAFAAKEELKRRLRQGV
ncbi:MAG: hypothetical protein JO038_01410 [Alphaproteobacteria bacterium]|nr:hypothetical protein [Alphaproteobacteria bacterium]